MMLAAGMSQYSGAYNADPMAGVDHSSHIANDTVLHDPQGTQSGQVQRSTSPMSTPRSKAGRKSSTNTNGDQPVRRRISRACDQCNQLRTKCDGKQPCGHCDELGLTCEYARERKKRGKASRKDIEAQLAAAGNKSDADDGDSRSKASNDSQTIIDGVSPQPQQGVKRKRSSAAQYNAPQPPQPAAVVAADQQMAAPNTVPHDLPAPRVQNGAISDRGVTNMSDYGSIDDYHRSLLHPGASIAGPNFLHSGFSGTPNPTIPGMGSYGPGQFGITSPPNHQDFSNQQYRTGESPLSAGGFLGQSPLGGSSGLLSLPSPSAAFFNSAQQNMSIQGLRYPVLKPLMPYISSILPAGLACDLLDLYFTSTSSVFMHPQSPYVVGYIFRKRSFLRQNNPRVCSPALLASMLWVSAQTSDSTFLTSPPSARGRVCQKLLELTVGLLKPLIHAPTDGLMGQGANTVVNGVALGGLGVSLPRQAHESEGGFPGASGAVDDVATYIHLATVVSASEYKAASLRWWNAAWTLARELKLNRELPLNEPPDMSKYGNAGVDANADESTPHTGDNPHRIVPSEEREERRRIWWLLFANDRHLSLCYNKPLFLLDIECADLLQPQDDIIWQAGEYYAEETAEASFLRRRGPPLECTGHSIFGYFLAAMTILGEIVELNQARNHPRFGVHFQNHIDWTGQIHEISQQLDAYGRSLKEFENSQTAVPPMDQQPSYAGPVDATAMSTDGGAPQIDAGSPVDQNMQSAQRAREVLFQTRIVVAYGTHLMHTLHILLNGKWDPISLLDDNDLWISSQSFISATGHAVSASEALNEILDYDPDLSFMPYFFGIYLLQSSFLLLLIADKLQGEASLSVVRACETIVRAHEACVVTLNTEYQRNFRKVMRSALAQVKGRMLEDFGGQQKRRREVLALYRWTGDGTGLAL